MGKHGEWRAGRKDAGLEESGGLADTVSPGSTHPTSPTTAAVKFFSTEDIRHTHTGRTLQAGSAGKAVPPVIDWRTRA